MWIDKVCHGMLMGLAKHSSLYLAAFIVVLVVCNKTLSAILNFDTVGIVASIPVAYPRMALRPQGMQNQVRDFYGDCCVPPGSFVGAVLQPL